MLIEYKAEVIVSNEEKSLINIDLGSEKIESQEYPKSLPKGNYILVADVNSNGFTWIEERFINEN